MPSWQSAAVGAYLSNPQPSLPPANLFNSKGRAQPDISALRMFSFMFFSYQFHSSLTSFRFIFLQLQATIISSLWMARIFWWMVPAVPHPLSVESSIWSMTLVWTTTNLFWVSSTPWSTKPLLLLPLHLLILSEATTSALKGVALLMVTLQLLVGMPLLASVAPFGPISSKRK